MINTKKNISDDKINIKKFTCSFFVSILSSIIIGCYTILYPFGRDQGIHATIAYALNNGLITYKDVFNIKPPGTTIIYFISQFIFGNNMYSIRIIDLISSIFTSCGIVIIVRQIGGSQIFACAASIAFAVIYHSYDYWTHAQTDGWAGFLIVAVMIMALAAWHRPPGWARFGLMGLAGTLMGVAFCIKYTIMGCALLILTPLLSRGSERLRINDVLGCIIGGTSFLLLLGLVMLMSGALKPFLEIQNFIRGYIHYSHHVHGKILYELSLPSVGIPWIIIPVMLGWIFTLWYGLKKGTTFLAICSALWILGGWFSGHVQVKASPYYFLPLLPPYALLIGAAVDGGTRLIGNRKGAVYAAASLLVCFWLLSPAFRFNVGAMRAITKPDPADYYAHNIIVPVADFNAAETIDFAKELRKLMRPEDNVFIWGYETMLYFLIKNPPHYRYPYSWPFAVDFYDGRYNDDLMNRLNTNPPRYFVVQKLDSTPWVTNREDDSKGLLKIYPKLNYFLFKNYVKISTTKRFDLYIRNK